MEVLAISRQTSGRPLYPPTDDCRLLVLELSCHILLTGMYTFFGRVFGSEGSWVQQISYNPHFTVVRGKSQEH